MSFIVLSVIECANYISIIKLLLFLVLFFPALLIIRWIYEDSSHLEVSQINWTASAFGAIAFTALIWLFVPIFWIGFFLYIIAAAVVSLLYVKQRNALVDESDKVLTVEHLKSLLEKKGKKKTENTDKYFVFVTANKNEVPKPAPKTSEFAGYKAAFDLFSNAIWKRAEIISLSPTPQNYQVIYQIDGIPVNQPSLEKENVLHFIHFIKNLADLDTEERRKPQKGKFTIKKGKESLEWHCVTAGSTAGEQLQIKVGGQKLFKLQDTGMLPEQLEQMKLLQGHKEGLFLISGPKKNGITTSFYAALRNHDAFLNNVTTLERQPSADLQNIVQNIFALSDTGTSTYDKKLRSIVRMGPEIVGVADTEDSETAKIICEAAKDNKLLYATLDAPSLNGTITKWIKLVGDKNTALDVLIGISCQRLIRKLCDNCKQAYTPNPDILRKFNMSEKVKVLHRPGRVQYDKRGRESQCKICQGTGYLGRVAIFELVMTDQQFKSAIEAASNTADINNALRSAKVTFIQEQILKLVINGTTSIEEMVRVLASQKAE